MIVIDGREATHALRGLGQLPGVLQSLRPVATSVDGAPRNLISHSRTPLDGVVAQRVPPVSEAPVEAERVRPPPLARRDADVRRGESAGQEALRRPREVARVQSLRGRFRAQNTIKGHARELVVPL